MNGPTIQFERDTARDITTGVCEVERLDSISLWKEGHLSVRRERVKIFVSQNLTVDDVISCHAGQYFLFLMGSSAVLPNLINKVQCYNKKVADLLASMTGNDIFNHEVLRDKNLDSL